MDVGWVEQHSLEVVQPWPSHPYFLCPSPPLTCGLPASGLLQVAQGASIVAQVVEGNASAVGGLEVPLLLLQHLEAVLAHPLIVHQL